MVISVAVCARADFGSLSLCLKALEAEGVQPLIVNAPRGHGLARARNEALAASDADVLAFVDDDVAVCPGWLDALEHAWRAAPEHRGCIGGPIAARFIGPRPAWLTDAMMGVLGVAAGRTFHGGNVSFRTDALRGIEGFWPARGRPELHDWFSEEHHAQHELAAAGWSSAQEPRAVAERLVETAHLTRRQLLERRMRYGARSALIGESRPRLAAARGLASSTVGTALAAMQGDDVRATDRAARAAHNAGALLAPIIAHADLQPTAAQTPFRHSVAPPQPRWSRWRRGFASGPIVLMYHRVDDSADGAGVTPAGFASHMEVVASEATPTPLEAIVSGDAPDDAVAITFDDGYAQTMRNVLPALEAADVPATLFVSTGHVSAQRGFWWDEVRRLLRCAADRPLRLTIDGETRAWARAGAAASHLAAWLQPKAPETIDQAMAELRAWAGQPPTLPDAERPLTLDELRALSASPLIDIGAHTRTHPNLRHVDPSRRLDELAACREDLAEWLNIDPPRGLAYPFGVPGADVDLATRRAAEEAGFGYAALSVTGTVTSGTDRYALPRVAAQDTDALASMLRRGARSGAQS
jgi:peptidoglycan/xylan/chitin deacetylase (PgdA/CDA1 family)